MSTETEICRIRGRVSQDWHYWTKLLQKDTYGLVRDWQKSKRHHVQITWIGKAAQRREKQEWAIEKPKTWTCQKIDGNLFCWSEWRRTHRHHSKCKTKVGNTKGSGNAMHKSVLSSMYTGNHCFKNRNSQGIWSKDQIQLYYWSPSFHKTQNRVSGERNSWRAHCRGKEKIPCCITI